MPATTITQAVLARFAGSSVTDFSAAGGLWLEQMPEQVALPFIGFEHGGESYEYTTEKDYLSMGSFSFTIFAVTVAETERLALAVMAVFDACIKSPGLLEIVSGPKVIDWERTNYRIGVEGIRKEDNAQIGRATFDYQYRVHSQLP